MGTNQEHIDIGLRYRYFRSGRYTFVPTGTTFAGTAPTTPPPPRHRRSAENAATDENRLKFERSSDWAFRGFLAQPARPF